MSSVARPLRPTPLLLAERPVMTAALGALGWLLITISLPRLPAALASVILTLQPVGAVVFAMLLLGEAPSEFQLLGAGAILGGLLLATAGRRSAAAPLLEGAPT